MPRSEKAWVPAMGREIGQPFTIPGHFGHCEYLSTLRTHVGPEAFLLIFSVWTGAARQLDSEFTWRVFHARVERSCESLSSLRWNVSAEPAMKHMRFVSHLLKTWTLRNLGNLKNKKTNVTSISKGISHKILRSSEFLFEIHEKFAPSWRRPFP